MMGQRAALFVALILFTPHTITLTALTSNPTTTYTTSAPTTLTTTSATDR
ncbi:MAG: hypothetical protein ABSD99_05120 [Candidatus Bathyarchaeia archaeon]